MKKFLLPVFLFVLALSCNNSSKVPTHADSLAADSTAMVDAIHDSLVKDVRKIGGEKAKEQLQIEAAMQAMKTSSDSTVGFWVGTFGHNKINIAISSVTDGKVTGYSVCAGNFRPLTGTEKTKSRGNYAFVLDEPGTDKYDGHFDFTINTLTNKCTGTWYPFQKDATEPKEFTLEKTVFVYNPGLGDYPVASQRLLKKEDVENMMKEDLTIMRTEIYARHGYSFKNKAIRENFDAAAWYIPMGVDIRENLTEIETKNINLIYTYEKYYADSYDDYGR